MAKNTTSTMLPRKVAQNLKTVGEQLKLARLRRDISIAEMAARATCSPLTIMRIEQGSSSTSIGAYLRVLHALGLDDDILTLAANDEVGRSLQDLSITTRRRASKQ